MDIIELVLCVFTGVATTEDLSPRAANAGQQVVLVLVALVALITCILLFKVSGGSVVIALICAILAVQVTIFIERLR